VSRDASNTCTARRKDGGKCNRYRATGSTMCPYHDKQRDAPKAEVVPIAERMKSAESAHAAGLMTREEYMQWLHDIMTGGITEAKQTSSGEWRDVEASARDKMTAGREFRSLMAWDSEQKGTGAMKRALEDIVADILG
jgi:hypothetical protein